MSKITLLTVNDGGSPSGTSAINQNFSEIVEAIDNTLSRDGSLPNHLNTDIDINGNDVLNAGNIDTVTLFINGVDVHEVVGIEGPQGPPGTPSDMLKSVYDPTDINASPFDRTNHTGTQAQSTVTGLVTDLAAKAPLDSPAFTGTPTGITKTHVGLGNVDNTSDVSKPVSTAQQTALDLKAPLASPTFTGTVSGITKTMVGLGNVDNTADTAKPVSTAQQTALNLKADLASPTFTGTVGGITKSMVGLGNVDNTSDANKPVSTAQQTALNLKADLASPTFTGIVTTAGQIAFPGTDNLSANATTLDTYREATFTPTIVGTTSAGAGTYTVQDGFYTRIGRLVFFTATIVLTAHTGTGNMRMAGLPVAGNAAMDFSIAVYASDLTFTGQLAARVSGSEVRLYAMTSNAVPTEIPIDTTCTLIISGSYMA